MLQSNSELIFRLTQASRAAALDTATNITLCGTDDFQRCMKEILQPDGLSMMAIIPAHGEEDEPVVYQYTAPTSPNNPHLRTPPQMQQ